MVFFSYSGLVMFVGFSFFCPYLSAPLFLTALNRELAFTMKFLFLRE